MSELISSLDAHRYLRATMTASSSQAGWRSLLLRAYDDPPEAEFTTPPTTDHLIVLVTEGTCNVEARYRGRWQTATYLLRYRITYFAGTEVKTRRSEWWTIGGVRWAG